MKVFLDFGHGGIDSGAVGNGMLEKDINLEVGLQVYNELKRHGVETLCSRQTDSYSPLEQRTIAANQWGADILVSIHHNAGGGDGAEGYHSVFADKGGALVDNILAEFKAIGQNIRNVSDTKWNSTHNEDYYGIIRGANCSAVLIEFGFIDTVDSQAFDTVTERTGEAIAITKGILKTLGIAYAPVVPVAPVFPGSQFFGPNKYNNYIFLLGQQLVKKGFGKYYKSGPSPTWGNADRLNVQAFQQAQGWTGSNADGIPGPVTWAKLFS